MGNCSKKGHFLFLLPVDSNDVCKKYTLCNNKTKAVGLAVTITDNSSMLPSINRFNFILKFGIKQVDILGSNFHHEEIMKLMFLALSVHHSK